MRFYLLQANDLTYFGSGFNKATPVGVYIFIGILLAVIVITLLMNFRKNAAAATGAGGTKAGGSVGFNPFANLSARGQFRNLGLNHEQVKMLNYAFRQDNVTDTANSLDSPALLDRHFKKAYRAIEQSSGKEEEIQRNLYILFSTRNALDSEDAGTKISSTRDIPDNSSAVLGYEDENYPVRVLASKGEQLKIENPKNSKGAFIQIPRGSKVTLSFFTKSSKGFTFETRSSGNKDAGSGASVLQLVHSNQAKSLSKRRFRRRQLTLPATFSPVNLVDTGRKEKKLVVEKRRLSGDIMDISVGGCSIKTNTSLSPGSRLKIEAGSGANNIAALGQVLRTNREGIKMTLHIQFLKVPLRSLNIINAVVYEYLD